MTEGTLLHEPEKTVKTANLFKPASWLSKIDFINHLTLFNNVLMAVLAEKQGGKTSFISLLKASLDNIHIRSTIITLHSGCSRNKLMSQLAEEFHLKAEHDMSTVVAQVNERKTHTVVIIDNAQYLDSQWISEVLTALKQQGSQGYFHACLFADYSIVPTLNEMVNSHYKNLIHTIELSGLSESETKIYIQHLARLEQIDASMINDDVVSKIYKATAGDFATIHSHLRQYLNDYYTKPKRRNKVLKTTAAAVSVGVVSAILTYNFLNHSYDSRFNKEGLITAQSDQINNALEMKESIEQAVLSSRLPSLDEGLSSREALNPGTVAQVEHAIPNIHLKEMVQKSLAIEKQDPVLLSEIAKFPGFPKSALTVKKAEPVNVTLNSKAITSSAKENVMTDEILYTIQLSARDDIKPLKRFIARNKLASKTKIHTIQGKNSKWYILTLGEYSNMTDARKDIKDLPENLSKLKPWIRPLDGLKKEG